MAEKRVQIDITAKDEASQVFLKVGDNLKKTTGSMTSSLGGLKTALGGLISTYAVMKAFDWAEIGVKAQQAEQSFRMVAKSHGENADQMIADMKRVSAGAVDDSDIMQKAVKGMVQGLNSDQLVNIMAAARVAARVAGEDVGTAYDKITDAIGNKMPKALVQYGLITKEQIKVVNGAIKAGVADVDLYSIAMANAEVNQAQFGNMAETTAEKFQRFHAQVGDLKETVGIELSAAFADAFDASTDFTGGDLKVYVQDTTRAVVELVGWIGSLADHILNISSGEKLRDLQGDINILIDNIKTIESLQNWGIFDDEDLKRRLDTYKAELKSKEAEQKASLQRQKENEYAYNTDLERMGKDVTQEYANQLQQQEMARLKASTEERNNAKKRQQEAEKTVKAVTSAEEKMAQDILSLQKDTFAGQVAILNAERDAYEKLGVDKVKLLEWYNAKHAVLVEDQTQKEQEEYEKRLTEAEDYWEKIAELGDEATGAILEQQIRVWEQRGGEWYEFAEEEIQAQKDTHEQAYNDMTRTVEGFYDDLFGQGADFELDWESMLDRVKGMLIKYLAEMTTAWLLGMQTMAQANAAVAATAPGGMTSVGGTANQAISAVGGNNSTGFNLFGGGTSTALAALYRIPGMAGILGTTTSLTGGFLGGLSGIPLIGGNLAAGLGGIGAFATGAGGIGSLLSGVMSLAGPIGIALSIASLFGGNLFGKSAHHEMRRDRRAGFWNQELSDLSQAGSWSDVYGIASNYPIYLGGRDRAAGSPFLPLEESPGEGFKVQHAGWEHGLEGQMSWEDYQDTLAYWDNITAAALNSLDSQKEATTATAKELADYKDEIELTKEMMGSCGDEAQEAAQQMIDMYNNMVAMTIADLTEKFAEGTIGVDEFTAALKELDVSPLETATAIATASLQNFLETARVGSQEFFDLYNIYRDNVSIIGELTQASQDMAQIQTILASGADLSEQQLVALVNYYRLLQEAIDGTIKSMEELEDARKGVAAILDAQAIATWEQIQLGLRGMTETQIGWATANSRYGFAGGDNTAAGLIEWAKTATYEQLEAKAKEFGVEVGVLINDIAWMDEAIKDAATAAEEAAAAYQRALGDTASLMEQARLLLKGGTAEEAKMLEIAHRWGWDTSGGRTEADIRQGIEWFMSQARPEDIVWMAEQKGMNVEQLIQDILYLAEQYGYMGEAVEDTTDTIRTLEQSLSSWQNTLEGIQSQMWSMQTTTDNPQNALERMNFVRDTIDDVLGGKSIEAYLGGLSDDQARIDAIESLRSMWGDYLGLSQEVYQRPSGEYSGIYNETLAALGQLEQYAQAQVSDYQVQLAQLGVLEQIAANTTPAGTAAPGMVPTASGTPGTGYIAGVGNTVTNYMGGPGIDTRYPPTTEPPAGMMWMSNYVDGVPFWYLAFAPTGSHAQGLDYVPYDNYIARLHEGEKVLTKEEARSGGPIMFNPVFRIDGSKSPEQTAQACVQLFDRYLDTDIARKKIQRAANGR